MQIKIDVQSINGKQVENLASFHKLPDSWDTQKIIEFMIEHTLCHEYDLVNEMDFEY